MNTVSFQLKPVPPFRLDLTAWALRRRANNIVDRWDRQCYRRVLTAEKKPLEISVTQPDKKKPLLHVTVEGSGIGPDARLAAEASLRKLLGTGIELSAFYIFARNDPRLRPIALRFRGLKPPQFPTAFEAAANAIACQQISLNVGIVILNRLITAYGRSLTVRDRTSHAFPLPEDLAEAKPETLRDLGFSRQKALALIELSQKISDGTVDLEMLKYMDDETAREHLHELRGIGRWSADYILLRGLGRIHIFPADDVGGRNRLQRLLALKKPLDFEGTRRIIERWRPYGGLIYFHLLLKGLEEEKVL